MVTVLDIIQCIEERYDDICERPHMHACDPESLELLLENLEDIREFAITGDPRSAPNRQRYFAFLERTIGGALGYVGRRRYDSTVPIENAVLFAELCATWRLFRSSEEYLRRDDKSPRRD